MKAGEARTVKVSILPSQMTVSDLTNNAFFHIILIVAT